MVWVLALAIMGGNSAAGAEQAWIQLQALPDLTSAESSARSFGAGLGADAGALAGFRLGTRWYLIALGPYAPAEAAGKMADLKATGRIPRDAYETDGADHGAQFWPIGASAAAPAAAPPVAPQSTLSADPQTDAVTDAPAPDETPAQARASEAVLTRDEKIALQQGLQWYGHYDGGLDGSFGPATRGAMTAWQSAMGYQATGVLTSLQRLVLMGNYQAETAAFGFETILEAEAGIEIALPAAMLEFDRFDPPFVRYRAKDGSGMQLLLISELGDETILAGLYDALQSLEAMPAAGERGFDRASFVINGADDTRAAFATARASKGTIKGFMLIWPAAQSDAAQRALGIMRASFRSTGDQVLDPGLVPLDETVRAGVIAGMEVKQPKSRISGIFVDRSGLVVTAAEGVAGCGKITLDTATQAEVVTLDTATGAAVLRPLSPVAPMAVGRLATASAPAGAKVLMAGYSLPIGLPAPVLTQAEIASLTGPSGEAGLITLAAHVTPHDLGGPVLDETGALLAMLRGTQAQGKTLPQGMTLGLPAASLGPMLAGAGVGDAPDAPLGGAALSPDALNAAATGMTVQVACWP